MKNDDIWLEVEKFRNKYPLLQASKLPIDLITFVDLDLGLDLIPYDGLARLGADAALLADFSGFYIDREIFDQIDTSPEWKLNRLRFSLGHELGHWVLHREIFQAAALTTEQHFLDWLNTHNGRKYELERDANEFAGRLLVPREILLESFDSIVKPFDKTIGRHTWLRDDSIRQKVCERIAPRFGVHPQAVSARFDREGIWPSVF